MESSRIQIIVRQLSVSVGFCGLLLILGYWGMTGWIRMGLEAVVTPSVSGAERVAMLVGAPFRTYARWQTAMVRLESLEEVTAENMVLRENLLMMEEEMEALKSQLGVEVERITMPTKWFRIVGGGQVMIDAGEHEGLESGMVVLDNQGILLGRLEQVGRFTSRISLPSDRDVRMGVLVGNARVSGILVGDGAAAQVVDVLQTDPLSVGDIVVTSGEFDEYPAGLVIGEISQLTGQQAEVTKGGIVELRGRADGLVKVVVR